MNRWEKPMSQEFRSRLTELQDTVVKLDSAIDKEAKLVGYIGNDIVIEREDGYRLKYHWSTLKLDIEEADEMNAAGEAYLMTHEGVDWSDLRRIFVAGAVWAKERYKVKFNDSDCICQYDQYGGATNPNCIIHGKRRS
jgi:hypothetical protein